MLLYPAHFRESSSSSLVDLKEKLTHMMVGLDKGMLITDCFQFIKAAALLEISSPVCHFGSQDDLIAGGTQKC